MYINIKSENPNLSFVLKKNPESGMIIKTYRKGHVFGWFKDETYNTYFKDGDDEISIQRNGYDFEYNDSKRYDSPTLVMGIITELFGDSLKKIDETYDIDGKYKTTVFINCFYMNDVKYFNIMSRYYNDIDFDLKEVGNNIYSVTVTSTKTVSEILMVLYTISMLYHSKGDTFITDSDIEKYINIINRIDAPYFVRYVFKTNYIFSGKKLSRFAHLLEQNNRGDVIKFVNGNTHSQREDFIVSNISGLNNILDIGCGDLKSYGTTIIKRLSDDSNYFAIDIDEEELERAKIMVNRKVKSLKDKVFYYNSFDEFMEVKEDGKTDVVMSEIFEHIKLKETEKYLKGIFNNVNWNKIIITTPNKDFNKYYKLDDDEMRLDDHLFEMNKEEFENYFNKLLNGKKLKYHFYDIGDQVNGVTPTQAIIIENK